MIYRKSTNRRHIKVKKTIALFMLFTILNQVISPTVAFALTAGPTAPEATNFEPIDTTDMVNPLTGDFTYNIPLLEVPGPEGGYPLALSYHAGIQPNEEASWVGLGWSLNPGAIARNVNGYPDDWNDATGVERDYWIGGSTQTIGVNVGIALDAGNAGVGLSFSQDTYRGFGAGESLDASFGIKDTPFSIGGTVGVSPYGEAYMGLTGGINGQTGIKGLKISGNIGIQTNFQSVSESASASVSYSRKNFSSSLGASISSTDSKGISFNENGATTSVNNVNANKISTESHGWSIPLLFGSVSYNYTRYWSDETTGFMANGVLYNRAGINTPIDLTQGADDNYQLLDPLNTNIIDSPDPQTVLGGTFPDFDNYSVSGQGLGGYIKPYVFSAVLYTQNRVNSANNHSKDVYAQSLSSTGIVNTKWQFRFMNDFSNSYTQSNPWTSTNNSNYSFDTNPQYGNGDSDYGYASSTNRLEGSKHIEYFTNDQITNGYAAGRGFIDCDGASGFVRKTGNQIGGFMITNSSGVTYHYALPVYTSNERVYMEKISHTTGDYFNDLKKNNSYAYTWYLTAITGPDYVHRTSIAGTSSLDWGYWVKFDYGKWSDSYNWRNPSEGFHRDLDNDFQTFSSGTKEVYYLDAIETRSHTALFVKDVRTDAKSIGTGTNAGFDNTSVSSLDLSYILLFKNEQLGADVNAIRATANNWTSAGGTPNNIIDVNDVNQSSAQLVSKCLRKVAFNYDNSLCPGVPNSFASGSGSNTTNLGKLSLLSVDFQGKGGASTQPPIQFKYDLDPLDLTNQDIISGQGNSSNSGTNTPGTITTQTFHKFNLGDILTFITNNQRYYCTLTSAVDGNTFKVVYLNNAPGSFALVSAIRTKNPPYNKDGFDNWNYYKSDYQVSPTGNENLSRFTTSASNKSIDVWSLRSILSSIGANINIDYEGDTYNKSALNKNRSLVLNSFTRNSAHNYTFSVDRENADLTAIYHVGDKISLILEKQAYISNYGPTNNIAIRNGFKAFNSDNYPTPATIQTINDDHTLTVNVDPAMDNDVTTLSGYLYHDFNVNGDGSTPVAGEQVVITSGNISANGANIFYGGGIRVRNITVDDLNGNVKKTSYNYGVVGHQNDPLSSTGVTSYDPLVFDQVKIFQGFAFFNSVTDPSDYPIPTIKREVYKNINGLLAISREVPPPGVMYESVTVADSSKLTNGTMVPIEGQTVYQYEVFKPEMIGIKEYHPVNQTSMGGGVKNIGGGIYYKITSASSRGMTIKDYTSRVGALKRIITYDNSGNKLTEKINHYLYDDLDNTSFQKQVDNYEPRLSSYNGVAYNNIGVIKEKYGTARVSTDPGHVAGDWTHNEYDDLLVMSNRETFPAIQTGTTQIDYKNGVRTDQTYLGYDFYSGAVTKTLTTDSYGNRFLNQVTPAYMAGGTSARLYPIMGLRTHDDDPNYPSTQHKQMLTQEAANYTFNVDASNNQIGVVSASVQTWSTSSYTIYGGESNAGVDDAKIWRKNATYSWLPSGTATNNTPPYTAFADYFGTNNGGSSNTSWKKTGQVTLYNVYSAALEASDINNNYAATRMGYDNSKVMITGSPAKYTELAYTGAEDPKMENGNFTTNVSTGNGVVVTDTLKAHTGQRSLSVPANSQGFAYSFQMQNSKSYTASVWVKPTFNIAGVSLYSSFNGSSPVNPAQSYTKIAGGWYLLEITIPPGNGYLYVWCMNNSSGTVYMDDFRVQPTAASANAYVYDNQTGELSYVLNNNNLYTRYQYDAAGRLIRVYKEVLGKATIPMVKAINYHYGRSN